MGLAKTIILISFPQIVQLNLGKRSMVRDLLLSNSSSRYPEIATIYLPLGETDTSPQRGVNPKLGNYIPSNKETRNPRLDLSILFFFAVD